MAVYSLDGGLVIVDPHVDLLTPKEEIRSYAKRIEIAGRTCYRSEDKITEDSANEFVRMVIRRGHESVLEHCSITVRFTGDRAMSHQLVRHRLAAYSQESQRYCNYGKSSHLRVVVPPSINRVPDSAGYVSDQLMDGDVLTGDGIRGLMMVKRNGNVENLELSVALARWVRSCAESYDCYRDLLSMKVRPEDARSVLPNATATTVVTTFNLRQWRHFFDMRCDKHAQWQIRNLAVATLWEFYDLLPAVFEDKIDKFGRGK